MKQAVNDKSRYKPVSHHKLEKEDIVLVKEENCKPINYPMAVVKETHVNVNGEVTDVILMKGATRETIRRHVTSLFPILSNQEMPFVNCVPDHSVTGGTDSSKIHHRKVRKKRKAVVISEKKTKQISLLYHFRCKIFFSKLFICFGF